ncbi:FAD-binding oxidoreductase [Euhalothece natronophila Z-M001]|uniref:FAD-binding oxidoreductase n=1 Tax=Euhalothece natronophila Z-M001 TaxID=522448 RepID=A0A5B8NIY5_9CHRO|nr:FAD-dependent oxidoreductase [Euhalothece natronophila]QDZ38897.1 FAD-binding oxidoreductase [Euhalothece natronophila Z-M001]
MKRIMIVGGGIVGATIAYELSKNSEFQITIIDKDVPAQASTGAALGLLFGVISQKKQGRAWELREISLRRYSQLLVELQEQTGETIPHLQGLIHLCFSPEEMAKWQELASLREQQGWQLELWNQSQLQAACPTLNTSQMVGAVYSPQDLQVNPQALTTTLLKAAEQNGVTLSWETEATAVSVTENGDDKHSHTVHTNQGDWEVDHLIIAAGLGSFPLTQHLKKPLPLTPVLGQAMRVRLNNDNGLSSVVTGNDVHLIPLGKNEYWVGATVEFPEQPLVDPLDKVWEQACSYYPALAEAEILETWSGERPRPSQQAAPVIEYLEGYDNVILATGHYRNGVLLAPATATKVKELL